MTELTFWKRKKKYLIKKYHKTKGGFYYLLHLRSALQVSKLKKGHQGIQLKVAEIVKVKKAIEKYDPCRFLVFGLGNDSLFWNEMNAKGSTLFLEDFKPWFDKITGEYPHLKAYSVSYPHNIMQWQELIESPEKLSMELPAELSQDLWDVILVDGPRGHEFNRDTPGRMSSIYMASQLVASGGCVLVHDAQRMVESAYASKYLGEDKLAGTVWGRALLKIYQF